jgi:branched-chain amino acid aminotransferase
LGGLRGYVDETNPSQAILFRLERHCQRLSNSAKYLHYDLPAAVVEIDREAGSRARRSKRVVAACGMVAKFTETIRFFV